MLFESINISNLTLKNRIVMPAINLGYSRKGEVNQRIIDFYKRRAIGEAGLIMVGGTAVESIGSSQGMLLIDNDSLINGHKKLSSAIKAEGSRAGIQLFHAGRYSFGFQEGKDVVAPSAIPSKLTGFTPRELTIDEIHDIYNKFADSAVRAREAGYEIIEVIMSAGYLVSQFLSPISNQRNDEFGGSLINRMKFPLEIIENIRKKTAYDYPLSVRLGANDFMLNGNTMQEMSLFAKELEKASVNMINVTGGWHESRVPQITSDVPRGAFSYLPAMIKKCVNIPVAASNRINNPVLAEEILRNRQADMICIGRGFLADSQWAKKARQGKERNIRRCIGCMTCMNSLFEGNGLECAVNPCCGKENESTIIKTDSPKKILVIGAGPAGLETARTAALRGHDVSIWENDSQIGGQWKIAAVPPGKNEFFSLLDFYKVELDRLNIKLCLGKKATLETVKKESPDIILVCTGARPVSPLIPGLKNNNVINSWEVLQNAPLNGSEIVVVGGGAVGCETALYVAEKGTLDAESLKFLTLQQAEDNSTLFNLLCKGSYHVSIVEMSNSLASDMLRGIRGPVIRKMRIMGIDTYLSSQVCEIEDGFVKIKKENEEKLLPADTVVLAVGSTPENNLYQELLNNFPNVYLLGDAKKPAKLINAVHQAFHTARIL